MIVKLPSASSSHHGILPALALIALATSASLLGCKPKPPTPTTSSSTPMRIPVTQPPAVKKHLYSADADPNADIASALKQARIQNKRVILDFGGDWCGDCQVLDIYLHQSPNLALFQDNFLLVHIDIGYKDKNVDVAEKYGIPLHEGVPALAVLDPTGKILYSQKSAEFGDMRYMQPSSVTDFLNKWKA